MFRDISDSMSGPSPVHQPADIPNVNHLSWQIDAHGFTRSNGNRPLMCSDITPATVKTKADAQKLGFACP